MPLLYALNSSKTESIAQHLAVFGGNHSSKTVS